MGMSLLAGPARLALGDDAGLRTTALFLAAAGFGLEAPLARRCGRLGRPSRPALLEHPPKQCLKASDRLLAIAQLATRAPRLNVQDALAIDTPGEARENPRSLLVAQARRVGHVEEQLDLRRGAVDVLPARSAGPREAEAELLHGDGE